MIDEYVYYHNVSGLFNFVEGEKWSIFIDSSKVSLEEVSLQNDKKIYLFPDDIINFKEHFEAMTTLRRLIKYGDTQGLLLGYSKNYYFVCLWDRGPLYCEWMACRELIFN